MTSILSDSALRAIENGILGLLLALGAACLVLFAWRWRAVKLAGTGARRWCDLLERDLTGELGAETDPGESEKGEATSADRLARVGLRNSQLFPEALEKLLETQVIRERKILERGAHFLGTVGANAPFLGLTGTVLGILAAFRRMADQGGSGGVEVMTAIAGALIATAAGLIVAIPAVVLFNLLKAKIRDTLDALAEIRSLILARSLQSAAKENF